MRFEKWQALGNDYVIVERDALPWELTPERIRVICAPHFGVGSDGVLLLSPPSGGEHVAELRIFNPDGSEAELSGNGAREAALYLRRAGWTDADQFSIQTVAGEIRSRITSPTWCAIAMGRASTRSDDYPSGNADGIGALEAGGREWRFRHVSIGNPQCVVEVGDEVEDLDLTAIGPGIEHHELFPNRTNVCFTRVDGSSVRARIYERGVGETMSSGTGACGAAVAAVLDGARSPISVRLDGGELEVAVDGELEVTLTGPAEPVFTGEIAGELLAKLERLDR
jgi:diaminopimelate epimerase